MSAASIAMTASVIGVDAATDLGRGAIAGALVVGAAFLAGFAVFRRGVAAACALLMVLAAAALEFSWLGLFAEPDPRLALFFQGLFAAAAILFLSSTIRVARDNALIGGLMFALALTLVGIGIINFTGRAEVAGLMRYAFGGVGLLAIALAASQAVRDEGARLLLPGIAAVIAAGVLAVSGQAGPFAVHALFTLGVLGASLVALTESNRPRVSEHGLRMRASAEAVDLPPPAMQTAGEGASPEDVLQVSENQLAQVLDYSGISVWDWSAEGAHQSPGLATLMGTSTGPRPFTPNEMRAFIHRDDQLRFDRKVLSGEDGDGSFDFHVRLVDGRSVRLRGARAADPHGLVERLVVFAEPAAEAPRALRAPGGDETRPDALALAFPDALQKGDISTVFQPIVSLETGDVVGFEALARWRGPGGADRTGAEDLVRAAQTAGRGRDLALLTLRSAAARLSEMIEQSGNRELFAAVNLTVAQICLPKMADEIRTIIEQHSLPSKSLVLELTESEEVGDVVKAEAAFRAIRAAGAALAFDDFGSGFSSLRNLSRFEFDYLKIDKSFIAEAGGGGDGAKIARALASLGRELGLVVIAEGVESQSLAETARALGCTFGQGYAFGKPEPGAISGRRNGRKDAAAKKSFLSGELR